MFSGIMRLDMNLLFVLFVAALVFAEANSQSSERRQFRPVNPRPQLGPRLRPQRPPQLPQNRVDIQERPKFVPQNRRRRPPFIRNRPINGPPRLNLNPVVIVTTTQREEEEFFTTEIPQTTQRQEADNLESQTSYPAIRNVIQVQRVPRPSVEESLFDLEQPQPDSQEAQARPQASVGTLSQPQVGITSGVQNSGFRPIILPQKSVPQEVISQNLRQEPRIVNSPPPNVISVRRPPRQPQDQSPSLSPNRNLPPVLLQGSDLVDFEISEDTPVNSEVYTLKAQDPEGSKVSYTISGDYFSVNRDSGVIKLREPLDREKLELIEVVITIQDEAFNLIPFRREIRVLDVNDNPPVFSNSPYRFHVDETVPVSEIIFTSVTFSDADKGTNSVVDIECDQVESAEGTCQVFDIRAQELASGSYVGLISLKQALDFETRNSYNMVLKATDRGLDKQLSAKANVFIEVNDIQDQKPYFVNAPYSATVQENTPPGSTIFTILVRDGDLGLPRRLDLSLEGDSENFFNLDIGDHDESGLLTATLRTSEHNIDREMEVIQREGGLYAFQIVAKEILSSEDSRKAGGDLYGDQVVTNVTIVITDQDDEIPTFNRDNFTVAVPEDVGIDTPLPDLNMIVNDADVSRNAEYELRIEESFEYPAIFRVYPEKATGRTPVIIRVADPERLDYESQNGRKLVIRIHAYQNNQIMSSATVTVLVRDSNDNVPVFDKDYYEFVIPEDAEPGSAIGTVTAQDFDSGRFGQVEYELKGFGSDKFKVNPISGEISVNSCGETVLYCLDYESQSSYALTFTGIDGGKQVTTTSLTIRVEDVNDNFPIFEQNEYLRIVQEQDTSFEQPLIIQATDIDGPSQGNGKIFYTIHSINTEETVFGIDPITGEISFLQPARLDDTEDGSYDIVVRATDSGKPPLFSDVKVTVKVGTIRNQKPRFLQPSYEGIVPENALPGHKVIQLKAEDPDGSNNDLSFVIHSGTKDNFVIDKKFGTISVAEDANLDIQRNGDTYDIIVHVLDKGEPFSQTGQATVTIFVQDINNKMPKFQETSYTEYVLESTSVGQPIVQVLAYDDDRNAKIEYTVIEPIIAKDKTGNTLQNRATYDFSQAFAVDPNDGMVFVRNPLSHQATAVIILTVQAMDVNADEMYPNQTATAEVTIYIQAYKADSPQFESPWTPSEPTLMFQVKEELPIGTVLFKLNARDPMTGQPITRFEKLTTSDPENLINISPVTGEVINNQYLSYEERKDIVFQVRALAGVPGQERVSDARIMVQLIDVNDHAPVFDQEMYEVDVMEDTLPLTEIIIVHATDQDTGERGEVRYAIEGEGSDAFTVDPISGVVMVKADKEGRSNLDRERQSEYFVRVAASDVAADVVNVAPNQQSSFTQIHIRILDVNDTPPKFTEARYSAVVPENSAPGTLVTRVQAFDPDLGEGGKVHYMFPEGSKMNVDLFSINPQTGEIFTSTILTGKGRKAPYGLTVRGLDKGEQELFTDVEVYITVGDVSSNDGVPRFIKPELDEVAFIKENLKPGSKVFQVEAEDPDDADTANGKIVYSLPDDGSIIRKLFQIDPVTGVLKTRVELDREERSEYTIILNVHDLGSPPQQTSRTLRVVVEDVDDHVPIFNRQRNSVPIELEVTEELAVGTEIGHISGLDLDQEENAIIDYAIIDGNDDRIFSISRGRHNEGVISIAKRLDREYSGSHLLTIKCFRPYEKLTKSRLKPYDNMKLDEIQVKVVVMDIDDNSPIFEDHNMTLGVRVNAPIYTKVTTLKAIDIDADSNPVHYSLENITFFRTRTKSKEILDDKVFIIDSRSGILQTNQTLGKYANGFFNLVFKASNGIHDTKRGDFTTLNTKEDFAHVLIYVLQDTELMKFVFDQDPTRVTKEISKFQNEIQTAFAQPLKFHLYDAEFYSKVDGSLDFGRTSSCFQVVEGTDVMDLESSSNLLDFSHNPDLKNIFDKYSVIGVERCATIKSTYKIDWVEISLIVIGVLIGLLALIAAISICCLYSNYKHKMRKNAPVKIVEAPVRAYIPASLPPGSIASPSIVGYDWQNQESTIPIDAASYRSFPHH